jgi:hypothetical protein
MSPRRGGGLALSGIDCVGWKFEQQLGSCCVAPAPATSGCMGLRCPRSVSGAQRCAAWALVKATFQFFVLSSPSKSPPKGHFRVPFVLSPLPLEAVLFLRTSLFLRRSQVS